MDISSGTAAAADVLARTWQNLQLELKLASDAGKEFSTLKEFNSDIGRLLNEAYSKEVIDEQLTQFIKKLRELLFDSEDAIEDLRRRSFLGQHYNKRTFTVESREIVLRWQNYINNFGKTAPPEDFLGLTSNHARPCSAGRGSSSKALDEKTKALVGIEEPMNELVRSLTENPQKSKMIFLHGEQGVGRTSLVAAVLQLVRFLLVRFPLVRFLTENPRKSKMIFLHGEQGVGKTSLVAAVLRHQSVTKRFKYCVWIEDLRSYELANNIEAELMKASTAIWDLTMEEVNNHSAGLAQDQGSPVKLRTVELEEAFRFIKNIKPMTSNFEWALVLDDVGKPDVFKFLKDHLRETRPSVLVTTRIKSLKFSSSVHVEDQYVTKGFEHVFLSKNDSRSLFFREMEDTYGNLLLKCENSPTLKKASDLILRRCKGLPLVILATSKLLKNKKEEDTTGDSDASQWKKWSGQLEKDLLSKWPEVGPNGKMVALRMDHFLDIRDYLLCLSIYPIDRPIRCSTMKWLWMAVSSIERGLTQEKAEDTLQKLLRHNVIRGKKTGYGRVKTSRVHNLLHQIIISRSKDEEFAVIVDNPNEKLPENVRHLSFHSTMGKIDHGTSVERLRSLHVFKEVYGNYLEKLLKEVKRLKVLHIQRHWTKEDEKHPPTLLREFPKNIVRSTYLRYLSLRGTNVRKFPKGIERLASLESLDLRDTLVDELPEVILKLQALCHLSVSRSKKIWTADPNPEPGVRSNISQAAYTDLELGVKAPSKLGDLILLQKLCMIELKPGKTERNQLLKELGKLTYLKKLGISKLESRDAHLLCASIEKLTNLVALRLIAARGHKIDLSKIIMKEAADSLQRVHLTGCLEVSPEWMLGYDNLVKLVLKGSQLTEDSLQRLGRLKSLKHLELEQDSKVIDMKFEAEKFKELRFLAMSKFDRLQSIQVNAGALPHLERLSLARCNLLTAVPPFITDHTELKCLELWDMPEQFNRELEEKELRKRMKVKSKKWNDPTEEEVSSLPGKRAWISRSFLPCMK